MDAPAPEGRFDLIAAIKNAVAKPHGHVTPIAPAATSRCGGPGMCRHCLLELVEQQFQVLARADDAQA